MYTNSDIGQLERPNYCYKKCQEFIFLQAILVPLNQSNKHEVVDVYYFSENCHTPSFGSTPKVTGSVQTLKSGQTKCGSKWEMFSFNNKKNLT